MENSQPLVTIAIPIHNAQRFLAETIESAIAQTYSNLEILLLENSSSDSSLQIAMRYESLDSRVRVIQSEKLLEVEINFNRALQLAQGKYLKILCSDDLIDVDCVEKQVLILELNPIIATCTSSRRVITADNREIIKRRGFTKNFTVLTGCDAIRTSCVAGTNYFEGTFATLYRTSIAKKIAPFNAQHKYVIDMDFCARTLDHGPLYVLNDVTGSYRARSNSYSAAVSKQQYGDFMDWVNEMIATKRVKLSRLDLIRVKLMLRAQVFARLVSYLVIANR